MTGGCNVTAASVTTRYRSSPRPTFAGATAVAYNDVVRHVWGDEESGEVIDWIYVSSDQIHQLVFGVGPGSSFRHSDEFRTVFAADEVLVVLSGTLVLANPATGEVHRILEGESAFFRRDTWHHAFSFGDRELRVLEFMSPPPAAGVTGAYAREQVLIERSRYVHDSADGRWPADREAIESAFTIKVIREPDILWSIVDGDDPALIGVLASTEHLFVGKLHVRPGQRTPIEQRSGDVSGYVLEGSVGFRADVTDSREWSELGPGDGFYVPRNVPYRFYNLAARPATILFGAAAGGGAG
jgi:quercetin dioxygenase-like cupin family protein